MKKDDIKVVAAQKCIELGIPFALYLYPDSDEFHFAAAGVTRSVLIKEFFEDSHPGTFAVSPFLPSDTIEIIPPEIMPEEIDSINTAPSVCRTANSDSSTDFEEYAESGLKVINELKRSGGKVVISRLIVAEGGNPVDVTLAYFESLPSTFRSLYFTPDKGIWLGATPELLATYHPEDKKLDTMSLAGTRKIGLKGDWDTKNMEEHSFVTDFIKEVLTPHCGSLTVSPLSSLRFGDVEHLCEKIEAKEVSDISEIIRTLSPTPAVCGTPRDKALSLIKSAESHSRNCYGGWLGVKNEGSVKIFVNLRCAAIFPGDNGTYIYKVYAGGGFTADSVIEDEWEEAELKASPLLNVLKSSLRDG